jgi:hypothetical protein
VASAETDAGSSPAEYGDTDCASSGSSTANAVTQAIIQILCTASGVSNVTAETQCIVATTASAESSSVAQAITQSIVETVCNASGSCTVNAVAIDGSQSGLVISGAGVSVTLLAGNYSVRQINQIKAEIISGSFGASII